MTYLMELGRGLLDPVDHLLRLRDVALPVRDEHAVVADDDQADRHHLAARIADAQRFIGIDAGRELFGSRKVRRLEPTLRDVRGFLLLCAHAGRDNRDERDRADQSIDKVSYHAFSRCLSCSDGIARSDWRQSPVAEPSIKQNNRSSRHGRRKWLPTIPSPRVINASSVVRSCSLSSFIVITASSFLYAVSAQAQLPTGGHADFRGGGRHAGKPHHVVISNSKKRIPERPLCGYMRIWPTAKRTTVAGYPALQSDMLLLFNKVAGDPPGAFQLDLGRAEPQSAFWHIGASVPAATKDGLEREGLKILPLYRCRRRRPNRHRSRRLGSAPYRNEDGQRDQDDARRDAAARLWVQLRDRPRWGAVRADDGADSAANVLCTSTFSTSTRSVPRTGMSRKLGMLPPPMLDSTGLRNAAKDSAGRLRHRAWASRVGRRSRPSAPFRQPLAHRALRQWF